MKTSFVEKLLERAGRLNPGEMQAHLARLAEDRGFLESIFNTLQEGVAVVDSEGRLTYWNRSASRLLSLPEDVGAGGWSLTRSLKGVDWRRLLQENRVSSGTIGVSYPEKRVLNYYLVPLDKKRDEPLHVAIFHDVTVEREKTEEAVEVGRAEALTLLAAGVAHEIGNPLNSLHLQMQVMERDLRGIGKDSAQKIRESIEICQQEIGRLDGLITQFLRAIRPQPLRQFPEDPGEVLEEALRPLLGELRDRKIVLETELAKDLGKVPMDRGQMKQAIYNVLRNAMQFVGESGFIRVVIRREEPYLVWEFRDNGPGIDPKDLPHLGQPFFTTRHEGTGLGLMIVQRIMREHGGDLQLESLPGKGAMVRMRIPLLDKRVHLLEERSSIPEAVSDV
ncbi:MAG: PAS domain-containing protein [Verrucomicrobia bacterium]|nr:PAS domain-containing protein [Verrucomicrobiota bacterium]